MSAIIFWYGRFPVLYGGGSTFKCRGAKRSKKREAAIQHDCLFIRYKKDKYTFTSQGQRARSGKVSSYSTIVTRIMLVLPFFSIGIAAVLITKSPGMIIFSSLRIRFTSLIVRSVLSCLS